MMIIPAILTCGELINLVDKANKQSLNFIMIFTNGITR